MFNENKFDGVPINTLIKCIQETAIKYLDPKQKRKLRSTKSAIKQMSEMSVMQQSLQARLKKLDRKTCSFFPIGSLVQYNSVVEVFKVVTLQGKVVGHDVPQNLVHVIFDTEPDKTIAVHPTKLKLLFIKMSFY